jgi:hypothetical protein
MISIDSMKKKCIQGSGLRNSFSMKAQAIKHQALFETIGNL